MKAAIFTTIIIFVTISTIEARNRLSVPLVGDWDFDIVSTKIGKQYVKTGEIQTADLGIKCVKSSDGTGNLKLVGQILRKKYPISFRVFEKEIKVNTTGRVQSTRFDFVPDEPGEYVLKVSIWGGSGYSWEFDSKNMGFKVEWGLGGFRCLGNVNQGTNVHFTFEFGPQVVNRMAQSRAVADQYARRVLWHILDGNIPKDKAAIAIAADIIVTTSQLQKIACEYKGHTIFYKRTFNDAAWKVAMAARTVDNLTTSWRCMSKIATFATELNALSGPSFEGFICTLKF